MPIKVRCKECSTVMTVSDQAAGRAVKCKQCGGRVNVPAADGGTGGGGAPVKRKRRPAPKPDFDAPSDPDDMFGGLDLRKAEGDEKVCPNCATVVDEEDIECPKCGVNIETGALSAEQRKRRARKGPPPEEFYSVCLPNAWKFLMNHKGFIVRTGITWGISGTMVLIASFVMNWYVTLRSQELIDSADGVQFTDSATIIEPTKEKEVKYDGATYTSESVLLDKGKLILPTPFWASVLSPPSYFWCFIFLVFLLGMGGWAWTLSAKIVEITLAKEKKIKRFTGDIFGDMTKGFTTIFWPIVLMYPVIWIPAAMYFGGVAPNVCLITFLVIFMIPYLIFLPLAVVHMAQPYTYRAWLLTWMSKDFINTIAPTLFVSALSFLFVFMIPLGIAIGVAVGWSHVSGFYTNSIEIPALNAVFNYTAESANSTFYMAVGRLPLLFLVGFLTITCLGMLLAMPAILMMRIFGLFGLYFRPDLALCVEQVPLSDAGFGPRFLAIQVDMIVASVMCGASVKGSGFVAALFGKLYESEQIQTMVYWITFGMSICLALCFYFANWESGSGRATLGKWTFGLIVLQDDNKPMPFKLAVKRFAMSLLSILSLSGTFVMCAFHPNHRAFHDLATKTKVVWRGDENQ
ncbi:MAG: RDD family protein [Planctomycetaceae bacterium]